MTVDIDIDDLLAPRLSAAQAGALAYGDATPVELSEDAVLGAARQRTGLSDFGADDFRERLNLLLSLWNADADVTNLHRLTLFSYATRHAANRLLIHDLLKRHPEIHDERVDRPIIVAGLPRSGTTHLVNLLAADPRLRSLPLWESYEPVPLPGEPVVADGVDPRYRRCAEVWEQMRATMPLLAAMHPMEPDHVHEELELMGADFASYNYEWLSPVPGWRDHYYASDQTPHYEYLRTVLKALQWMRGPRRWVLKCPQHLEQLPVLRTVFPDATVAITHRDPVAVIRSTVTMIAYGQRMYRKTIEPDRLIAYWSDRIDHLLRACVRDRAVWPETQSVDVLFHEFMADDLSMAEVILETAGLPMTAESRRQIGAFLEAHPRGKEGRMTYHLKRDFGVDPDDLRRRFKFYFDAFPVRAEGRKDNP